jgi:hypothetical protein
MHLFNTLIDKKESHVIDLWTDFILLFDFNEETTEIEKLTNDFILKFKTEIQENLSQLSENQQYLYLDQLKTVFSKELPGLNSYLHESCVKSIVEKEFPKDKEEVSVNLEEILSSFNTKYKYVNAVLSTNTIKTTESFPYVNYWLKVKTSILDFVKFALDSVTAKNSNLISQPKLTGFKKLLLPNQIESLYNQFNVNPYRAVLVALDMLLTDIDEIADSKALIKYIANYHDSTSNLNTLGKLVAKVDVNDPETQLFFNSIRDALNNYTAFKFLPDDCTELRDFFSEAYSPAKSLLVNARLKELITLKELQQFKLDTIEGLIELHKIADKSPELLESFKEHLQLLYRNVILDTCIFPLDPVLNGDLFTKTNGIPDNSEDKSGNKPQNNYFSTKAETSFFELTEKINLRFFDKNSNTSVNDLLNKCTEDFKKEFIANISNYSGTDREFYINRLKKRLEALPTDPNEAQRLVPINSIELNKLEIDNFALNCFYSTIKHCKTEILQFVENLAPGKVSMEDIENFQPHESIFPNKDRTLLTIKEIIFSKSPIQEEPDNVWLSRFVNNDSKLEPVFPNGKGVGRKGNEFTEAKIWQAALIDIIKVKLKETGCVGTTSKLYFLTKWGIDKYDTFITNRSEKESFLIAKNQFQSLLQ